MQNLTKRIPLVTVIVPTFNSGRFLEKCLMSIRRQSYKSIEIIVVDDGSTDDTLSIVETYRCRFFLNPRKGRAEAKNEGIRQADGDYVLFVDSDMELTQPLISECVGLAEKDKKIGGIVIPERSIGESFWVKTRDFERSFYAGTPIESARFFPTRIAKKVGGFSESLIFYEESTLPYKIQKNGYDVSTRIKSLVLHHEENFSLENWLKKKFMYGKTLRTYSQAYSDYYQMQTGISFRLSLFLKDRQRFFRTYREACSVIILKSLEYAAISLGRICSVIE